MTIHWKAVKLYFTEVLFQFYLVCNFGRLISFGLDTVRLRSERVNTYRFIPLKKIDYYFFSPKLQKLGKIEKTNTVKYRSIAFQ